MPAAYVPLNTRMPKAGGYARNRAWKACWCVLNIYWGKILVVARFCLNNCFTCLNFTTAKSLNSTSWEECCDACEKNAGCVAWTHSLKNSTCLLRDTLGTHFKLKESDKVSGILQSSTVPTPQRERELLFHVGVLSSPGNRDKVSRPLGFTPFLL